MTAARHLFGFVFAAIGGLLGVVGMYFIRLSAWCLDREDVVEDWEGENE